MITGLLPLAMLLLLGGCVTTSGELDDPKTVPAMVDRCTGIRTAELGRARAADVCGCQMPIMAKYMNTPWRRAYIDGSTNSFTGSKQFSDLDAFANEMTRCPNA